MYSKKHLHPETCEETIRAQSTKTKKEMKVVDFITYLQGKTSKLKY